MTDWNEILIKKKKEIKEDPTSCKANFKLGFTYYKLERYKKQYLT